MTPGLELRWSNGEEFVSIYVNGQLIFEASHDDHGHAGMESAVTVAVQVAMAQGLPVSHTYWSDEDEEEQGCR